MGFIPQINTKTLYAYLTPKGRQYILDGDKVDFQVEFFSLHDDDVNYYISSNISAGTTSTYYTLQSGFIPDITGDNDSCIKSIAKGTSVNTMCTLSGGTDIGPIGNDGTINGRNSVITIQSINAGTLPPRTNQTAQFNITISAPVGQTSPLTPLEITNSKFYISIINPSPTNLIGNFKISGVSTPVNTNFLYTPKSTNERVDINYDIIATPQTNQTINFEVIIIPFNQNNVVTNRNVTYTASYNVTTSGPPIGTNTTTTQNV